MNKPNPFKPFLFVLALAMAPFSLSDNVTVITHLSANWAETERKGFAVEFNRALTDQVDLETELLLLPLDRAILEFSKPEYHCYMGGNNAQMAAQYNIEITSSLPISEDHLHIFTLKGSNTIESLGQVIDLRIGVARGMERTLSDTITANNSLVKTPSTIEAFRMLQAKRIDAFLSFESGITPSQSPLLNYDPNLALLSVTGSYNCKDSDLANAFIKQINHAITSGHANHEFNELFERYSKTIPSMFNK